MSPLAHALRIDLCPTDAHGTGWHEHLAPGEADLGRVRLGPAGLARKLAGWLGVPPAPASQAERVAIVDRILEAHDDGTQWLSATRATDRVGSAQWLLDAHDSLRTHGWRGAALDGSPRLRAISLLRDSPAGPTLLAGQADVLHAVADRLLARGLPMPVRVALEAPAHAYPAVVQRILDALEGSGAQVDGLEAAGARADADSDLGKLQRALLGEPPRPLTGDGTLRLITGESPWEAAACCTARASAHSAWLVTAEGYLLDRIRRRFDKPTLGLADTSRWRPALQVLPLALSLQTAPQDPEVALELLTLPDSPTPKRIRPKLIEAMRLQPAVGSPKWREKLGASLATHAADRGVAPEPLRQVIDVLFPTSPRATVTVERLIAVCEVVHRWALTERATRDAAGVHDGPILLEAAMVAQTLGSTLRRLPAETDLEPLQVLQYYDIAAGGGVACGVQTDASAPPATRAPESVPVGTRHLTWFGAVAGAAEQGPSIHWTEAERAALLAAGVRLPADGAERQVEQEAWIHAVLAASERLDVVSWLSSGSESVEPHPMLDLWSTRLPDGALDAIRSTTRAWLHDGTHDESVPIPAAPGVQPRAMWRVPAGALDLNRKWSASSIEALIRCPLQWTLSYAASLRTGEVDTLPALRNLAGSFAHALFEEVLFEPEPGWDALTPEGARERLLQRFSERVDTEAALLTLPENETFGAQIRERLGHAAAALVSQLKDGGWHPHAAEQKLPELGARFAGSPMAGSIDLVVKHRDGRLGVIDLKLGGSSYRRRTLREGTALQLAVYGKAAAQATGVFPPVAYFILEDGELLTTDEAAFPSASHQAGLDGAETMAAVDAAWSWWARTLEAGVVTGRGTHLSDDIDHEALDALSEAPPDHPWVDKPPSCHFCDLERLCTFSLDGGAS